MTQQYTRLKDTTSNSLVLERVIAGTARSIQSLLHIGQVLLRSQHHMIDNM
jgi:hypothetical protein